MVPYLEDYGYFTFRITNDANRICDISEHALDGSYRDLLITEDIPENVPSNRYPALVSVEFLTASCISRFSARLTFDNREIRRYDFPVKENAEQEQNAEVVEINHFSFTDRIFRHGKIVDHIDMLDWFGEHNYPQRCQGLSFVNGYSISTAELYFNSHPLE